MGLSKLKIGLHNYKIITGDITGNLEKIKDSIKKDKESGCNLSIFPETALTGYMCGSLWDREDFIRHQKNIIKHLPYFLQQIDYDGAVIIGYVDYLGNKSNGFPHLKNAAAIITKKSFDIYHKQLLASADHHEDKKYFDRGDKTKVFTVTLPEVGKLRIGIPICEDIWITDHKRQIPEEMVKEYGADILININQSYFYYGKQEKRLDLLKTISKDLNVPIISVNALGVGDILKNIVIFDGGATIFNERGKLVLEMPRFKEQHYAAEYGKMVPSEHKILSKYSEITQALIFEQQEFYRVSGIKKAQVHVSGGLDSAIVAAIVNTAMGSENTIFITNPSKLNHGSDSFKYAEQLVEMLGNELYVNEAQEAIDVILKSHLEAFDWQELNKTGQASIHAVLRTVQGLAASHHFKSGIVATGNHTEIVLGWASFHDIGSIGVHAILGDLTKVELFQLAKYLNEEFFEAEVIPEALYNGLFKPAAELPDAMEDPIDYWVQSGICAMLIRDRMSKSQILDSITENKEKLNKDYFPKPEEVLKYSVEELEKQIDFAISKMRISVYKAGQAAPIVIISPRSRGFSNRETLINYYLV
jgi:NAD+ synthase (glutamine-hydrolysing)